MDSFQNDPLLHAAPPAPPQNPAEPPITADTAATPDAAAKPDADDCGPLIDRSAIEVIPIDPYAFDMDVDRLDEHDSIRVAGLPLAELSDAELAAMGAEEEQATDATPTLPAARKPPAVLALGDLNVIWPEKHVAVHMRVDRLVMDWFSRGGETPGPRMAAVLRAYVDGQLKMEAAGS